MNLNSGWVSRTLAGCPLRHGQRFFDCARTDHCRYHIRCLVVSL